MSSFPDTTLNTTDASIDPFYVPSYGSKKDIMIQVLETLKRIEQNLYLLRSDQHYDYIYRNPWQPHWSYTVSADGSEVKAVFDPDSQTVAPK